MKTIPSSFPILREAKVINTTDPEKLGRIQLKVYPELSEIPDGDCPWCFPNSGGVHGKSFGVPLVGQLISCVVWNRFWNEISFLPFNITNPQEHIFDNWMENQRPEIADMETDPEEEHLVVEQFENDFSVFHDTKNNQHGYLHPTGTYVVINKDGNIFIQSVKKYTFHNKDSDLFLEADSESGDVTFKTKGMVEETVENDWNSAVKGKLAETVENDVTKTYKGKQTVEVGADISVTGKANWKVNISGNTEIKTTGNTKIESSGQLEIKSSGPCKIESSAMTTVKGSSMVVADAPILKFSGSKSMGTVPPSGSGICCAIPICPATGVPHTG